MTSPNKRKFGQSNKTKLSEVMKNDKLSFAQKWEVLLNNYGLDAPGHDTEPKGKHL